MIPFYPKFGAAEDAPNYRISESEDRCESCAHYRNLGPEGYCEKFSFTCGPEYVCDDFRPAGVVKESSITQTIKDEAVGAVENKVRGVERVTKELSRLRALRAIEEARKGGLVPPKYEKTIKAVETIYPKVASGTDAFLEGLHPIPGSIVSTVAQDQLDPEVSADEMRRRRALGMAGGALSGGVLVPGVIATGIGGARGAFSRRGLRRIPASLTGARAALSDTFHRASIPALSAGAGLGALGVKAQHDTGAALANLASSKTEQRQASAAESVRDRLSRMVPGRREQRWKDITDGVA